MKQRLLVYNRGEVFTFLFASFLLAIFTFTLGLHFGKQFVPVLRDGGSHGMPEVATLPDAAPESQLLLEQSKAVSTALDTALLEKLHQAVQAQHLKFDAPRQLVLPDKPKSQNAGKTTLGTTH